MDDQHLKIIFIRIPAVFVGNVYGALFCFSLLFSQFSHHFGLSWFLFNLCLHKKTPQKNLQLSFAFTILFNFIFYFLVFSGASFSFHIKGSVMFLFRPSVIRTQTAGAWQSLKSGHDGQMVKKRCLYWIKALRRFPANRINEIERSSEDFLSCKTCRKIPEMLLTVESDVQVLGDNINDSTADRIKWCVIGDIRSGLSSAWVGLRGAAGVLCLAWICLYQVYRSELLKTLKHVSGAESYPRMPKNMGEDSENLQKVKRKWAELYSQHGRLHLWLVIIEDTLECGHFTLKWGQQKKVRLVFGWMS